MAEDISKSIIAGLIIVSLVAIIMIPMIAKTKKESFDLVDKEICKKSVEMQALTKNTLTIEGTHLIDKFGNQVELKCPTQYLKIDQKEDEIVKRKIADSMYHCWDQFGKGKYSALFDTADNSFCVVCSRLEFTKKKEVKDFTDFLMNNNPIGSEKNYFEILSGIKMLDREVVEVYKNSNLEDSDTLNLENPLAVMFVMDKNAYPDAVRGVEAGKLESSVVGVGGGALVGVGAAVTGLALCGTGIGCIAGAGLVTAGVGGVIGYFIGSDTSEETDSRIVLWDYDKITDPDEGLECTYLEGQSKPLEVIA